MPDSDDRGGGEKNQRQEVEVLVRRLEPRIIEIFRSADVPPAQAGQILEEVVTLLLYRWENVTRPETWLLEMLNRRSDAAAAERMSRARGGEDEGAES